MEKTTADLHALAGLDLAEYDRLVAALYDAALDSRLWHIPMEQLRDLFAANYVTLILRVPDQSDAGLMIVAGNVEGEGKVTYLTYPHSSTPFINQPVDKVFTVDDLMSEKDWRESSYYQHWCGPKGVYHVMGVDIATPDSGKLRFRITRPESAPKFSARDRALCELILPHLRRALNMHNQLDRSQSMGTLYSQAISRLSVATIVLDESGRVLQQNAIAQEILAGADGLKVVGGRLEASYPSDNRELQRLVRNAFARQGKESPAIAEAVSIARPSGQVSLVVVVESVPSLEWAESKGQPAVVVYIRDAVGKSLTSTTVAKQLFNLTPAETALCLELANGLSLEEAAEALNIRRNTARAHLRAIFSKTGVRRQTELVRIMLNSVMAVGQTDGQAQRLRAG
ncbi:DNA-binding transcriptional regulator, CsgD family [Pseudomonas sp. OF001]|uniref:helix-turn-helix transcriptional regulator n=1 Tax=unclassified Pseudomonas TaxID=196821 RepID=UPI0019B7191C|nr:MULTISPECIES: helix-turn-helix transcriptional regulator [unclassified Pseudomonas]WPP46427.1 helix-turn-helix transcriptional regulator [Pseudomonas sp. AN-1]CAD5378305.1 DNA-binding transcriptional regulator, CsgD family [Pseudomonas sp. OF001]